MPPIQDLAAFFSGPLRPDWLRFMSSANPLFDLIGRVFAERFDYLPSGGIEGV